MVSIPHRQAKNVLAVEAFCGKHPVSIPHRQAKNVGDAEVIDEAVEGFNSS